MKRQINKDQLSKLYREFSRQRYNKYKHQFPKMRESEIVSKIVKEWEGLDHPSKNQLYHNITSSRSTVPNGESESSSEKYLALKINQLNSTPTNQSYSSASKSLGSSVKLFIEKDTPKKNKEDQSLSQKQEEHQRSQRSSSNDGSGKKIISEIERTPPLKKHSQNSQYISFFRYHYGQLTKEHPRWKCKEISTIVRLLWKKRAQHFKKHLKHHKVGFKKEKVIRKVPGKTQFRKEKIKLGLESQEITSIWKQLPLESRNQYKVAGESSPLARVSRRFTLSVKPSLRKMENSDKIQEEGSHILGFLHKQMIV